MRANGMYICIMYIYPKKLQFAAYGQFVLMKCRNTTSFCSKLILTIITVTPSPLHIPIQ